MRNTWGICILTLVLSTVSLAQDQPVRVVINGNPQQFKPGAFTRAGKAYVPLRQVADAMGATVRFDPASGAIKLVYCGKVTWLHKSHGPTINGTLFMPLRPVAEAFNCDVAYQARTRTVVLSDRVPTGGG